MPSAAKNENIGFHIDFEHCAEHAARMAKTTEASIKRIDKVYGTDGLYDADTVPGLIAGISTAEFQACMVRKGRNEYGGKR